MIQGTTEPERAFVLGLDGVPWSLVERWAADGHLPNFARLLSEGVGGPLESTMPPSTPLAWPSIATGVRPDKHGIYAFQKLTPEYTRRMYTSRDLERPPVWEMVSPAVVGNVPMTYPAEDVDGRMVAGIMAPEINDQYASPPDLAAEIQREIPDYEISLYWEDYVDRQEQFVADIGELTSRRKRLLDLLLDADWRLCFFAFMGPDRLQHLVWDEAVLREYYADLDGILGDVMTTARDANANLFVVSDHGFGPVDKTVGLSTVLRDAGHLHRQESTGTRGVLDRIGVTKDRLDAVLSAVGVDETALVRQYLPRWLVDFVSSQVPGDHALYDLDHGRTEVVLHEFGQVYVNDTERFARGAVDPDEVSELKRDLTELFARVTDPETDDTVLTVHDGDVLFPEDDFAPDLVVESADGYGVSASLSDDRFQAASADAGHRKDGVFLAWGPNIESGSSPDSATVYDVAPTLLHSIDRPVPADADGRVLDEIFDPGSVAAEAEVRSKAYAHSDRDETVTEDFDDVKERLQGLGYMKN